MSTLGKFSKPDGEVSCGPMVREYEPLTLLTMWLESVQTSERMALWLPEAFVPGTEGREAKH